MLLLVFESLYLARYTSTTDYFSASILSKVPTEVQVPSEYEEYSKSETNYGYSTFMALILAKETSFEKVLKEFTESKPTNTNWPTNFENVFGMTVATFYAKVITYSTTDFSSILPPNISSILPSVFGIVLTIHLFF